MPISAISRPTIHETQEPMHDLQSPTPDPRPGHIYGVVLISEVPFVEYKVQFLSSGLARTSIDLRKRLGFHAFRHPQQ